jgi:hypothetical protein
MVNFNCLGMWKSSEKGETWTRMDGGVISGRGETGWAVQVDQNDPKRIAVFSLDGAASYILDGKTWKQLYGVVTPDPTDTWKPVPHIDVVNTLTDGAAAATLSIRKTLYLPLAVAPHQRVVHQPHHIRDIRLATTETDATQTADEPLSYVTTFTPFERDEVPDAENERTLDCGNGVKMELVRSRQERSKWEAPRTKSALTRRIIIEQKNAGKIKN